MESCGDVINEKCRYSFCRIIHNPVLKAMLCNSNQLLVGFFLWLGICFLCCFIFFLF